MKKYFLLSVVLVGFCSQLFSQNWGGGNNGAGFNGPRILNVMGMVNGSEGTAIKNAKIQVFSMADTFYSSPTEEQLIQLPNAVLKAELIQVKTDNKGEFTLSLNMPLFVSGGEEGATRRGNRKHAMSAYLVVSADGYVAQKNYVNWRTRPSENGFEIKLEPIVLLKQKDKIDAVEIKTKLIVQKGDTTEMNAGNFQVNPDATAEDLVRKMPGVTSSNGQVQAQGEQVKKVLVDGKPFFGDDPNTALKNLPADVISKIQIFDGRSDQSAFTGFDDGNTTKTMNIITKMGFKNGMFGKAFGGYGQSFDGTGDVHKYKGGLNVNYFSGDKRITFLSQVNNINEQNFSIDDIMGAMGASGGRGGRGTGGMGGGMFGGAGGGAMSPGQFFVNSQGGINTTNAMGLNYSDKWGKKKNLDVSGSYFLNRTVNDNSSSTVRYYITGANAAEGLRYLESDSSLTTNVNHRFNLRLEWRMDSLNKLIVQPRLTLQSNNKNNPLFGNTYNPESPLLFANSLSNLNLNESSGLNGGVNVNWLHSFLKKGRTLSVNVNPGFSLNSGLNDISSSTKLLTSSSSFDTLKIQKINTDKWGQSLSGNLTFTEGIDSNHLLSVSYNLNYNLNQSDRLNNVPIVYGSNVYVLDTLLSNKFNNGYSSHNVGGQYQFQNYKWNASLGLSGQVASLDGDQVFPRAGNVNRIFYSVLPNASLRYKLGMKKNVRINYRTSNNAPSIDQLQEVLNNSNLQQLSIGNSDLVQDYQHNLTMRYFSVDMEKSSNVFFMINATYTKDYITSLTNIAGAGAMDIFLKDSTKVHINPGSQLTQTVNMDGYYNLRIFGNYGKPFFKGKLNVNLNGGVNYSQTPSQIKIGQMEVKENYARNPSANFGLVLGTNMSKLDITVMSNSTLSFVQNTLQKSMDQSYVNQNTQLRLSFNPNSKWVISSDLTHQLYTGLTNTLNQSYVLWNMGFGKKFGKKNQSELRLSVYDMLNQNRSIARNVTQTYFEDVKARVLTRYAMITYTYTLKQLGNDSKDSKDKKMMMFPGGMMPPPGIHPPVGGF